MEDSRMPKSDERKLTPGEKRGRPKVRWRSRETYERWGLKDGEEKFRIETSEGE
jgi:hypothetical protein